MPKTITVELKYGPTLQACKDLCSLVRELLPEIPDWQGKNDEIGNLLESIRQTLEGDLAILKKGE